MTTTKPDPWRTVHHIAAVRGRLGGYRWKLTLECGHTEYRPNPKPRLGSSVILGPVRFAPQRVRCIVCGALESADGRAQG